MPTRRSRTSSRYEDWRPPAPAVQAPAVQAPAVQALTAQAPVTLTQRLLELDKPPTALVAAVLGAGALAGGVMYARHRKRQLETAPAPLGSELGSKSTALYLLYTSYGFWTTVQGNIWTSSGQEKEAIDDRNNHAVEVQKTIRNPAMEIPETKDPPSLTVPSNYDWRPDVSVATLTDATTKFNLTKFTLIELVTPEFYMDLTRYMRAAYNSLELKGMIIKPEQDKWVIIVRRPDGKYLWWSAPNTKWTKLGSDQTAVLNGSWVLPKLQDQVVRWNPVYVLYGPKIGQNVSSSGGGIMAAGIAAYQAYSSSK